MPETKKKYRVRTDIGDKLTTDYLTLDASLVQDYDTIDILSVSINTSDTYRLHSADYGVVVGRVLANNGFGIPNAKLSIFIEADDEDGDKVRALYPFTNSASKNSDGVRYNLLPDNKVSNCHQIVGTFPNKRYTLDNDVAIEVFDKYYKYTTRTNNAGDYCIVGVPTGAQTIHMDLDLSDCGILSQRPRDFVYKGYTIEQFENPNMFKSGTEYGSLSQVFTQDQVVNVKPFWGNESLGEEIGITRADINVAFTFEPTCVFIGSVISDNSSQGITKKCMGTESMGNMEELVTGEGTIEMIRKTPNGNVEEFQVKGTQLINADGIWCYQIPMNLDYMMTDEYGNMVPTDDPSKGIPTRTRVRFRISMQDNEENVDNYFRAKVLVPHNPQNTDDGGHEDYDYEFGTYTRDDSFRDLFWNNVYSVKSYIPRFQKRKSRGWKDKRFVAIKSCNFYGSNNPIPYNNIRIRLPFMFTVMCALIKTLIFIVGIINTLTSMFGNVLSDIGNTKLLGWYPFKSLYSHATGLKLSVLKEGLCPDLDNWYFSPMSRANLWVDERFNSPPPGCKQYDLLQQTLDSIMETEGASTEVDPTSSDTIIDDPTSIDYRNKQEGEDAICLTIHTDYLISCIEMNLAMEYRVINFDFYNDWLNGTIYFPRFMRYVRPKRTFLGLTILRSKVKGCMDDPTVFSKTRRYTQQCSLSYRPYQVGAKSTFTTVKDPISGNSKKVKAANNFHKKDGFSQKSIFGANGGICHEHTTMAMQYVYYMKPCEWFDYTSPSGIKVNFFATDIILLGSLNDCDLNGVPQAFKYLAGTSYVMPTNLALTNMEENGPLYANDNGTICAQGSESLPSVDNNASKISVVPQSSGLSGEIVYFSGGNAADIDLSYDGNEPSDIIALTEAAGISWNFTGPGQGEPDDTRMYAPGGHFLGLSCSNSQTNIKSCINLSRICEVGANMSQRREDVSGIDDDGNLKYTYSVPTGFISGDDIVGEEFRSMFATMNQNRLIATKTNPETGYKVYDFVYLRPINFNGAFKNVVDNGGTLYNGMIEVPDEDTAVFKSVGINPDGTGRDDYDYDEYTHTQTRTIEDTSIDYYMFRMGLKNEECERNNQMHLRKFLINQGSQYYLPQYENSYYFYFGLKAGATALDEFNKEFFSVCDTESLSSLEPSINLSVNDFTICSLHGSINVVTNNLETPYQYIRYWKDGENSFINIDRDNDTQGILQRYQFEITGCTQGTYNVLIVDASNTEVQTSIVVGGNLATFTSYVRDFNCVVNGPNMNDNITFRGGYVEVSNVRIPSLPESVTGLTIEVHDSDGNIVDDVNIGRYDTDTIRIKVNEANVINYLYVSFDCGNGEGVQRLLLQEFMVKDGSSLNMFMGVKGVAELPLSTRHLYNEWWKTDNTNATNNWIEKYCTFNTINDSNRGVETFCNNVIVENGTKVIWGTPQNNRGFYSEANERFATYCSEDYQSIPNGYMLDDDFSYYSTYQYELVGKPKYFSLGAYNNRMVYGDYYAKFSGYTSDGVANIRFTGLGSIYFHDGCGYIFKPLPEGDLQFFVYDRNGGGNRGFMASYSDDEGNRINAGVFYPSFLMPVIHRPFYVEANFFVWQHRFLNSYDEDGNVTDPYIDDVELCGKTELRLFNGITIGAMHDFNTASTIPNVSSIIRGNGDDKEGIETNTDRSSYFNSFTYGDTYQGYGVSGVTDLEFNIICGTPDDSLTQYADSLTDYVGCDFANYVRYTQSNQGEVKFAPSTDGSNRAIYYMCKNRGGNNNMTIKSDDDAENIAWTVPDRNLSVSVMCYVNGGPATTTLYVRFKNRNNGRRKYLWKWTHPTTRETFKDGEHNKYLNLGNNALGDMPVGSGEHRARKVAAMFREDMWPELTLVTMYGINFDNMFWKDGIENSKLTENELKHFEETAEYFAVGEIYGEGASEDSYTTLYKIYPNLMYVDRIGDEVPVDIMVNPETLSFDGYGGNGTFSVTGSAVDNFEIELGFEDGDEEWYDTNITTGRGVGIEVVVTVTENPYDEEREETISVVSTEVGANTGEVTVTQGIIHLSVNIESYNFGYRGGDADFNLEIGLKRQWSVEIRTMSGTDWLRASRLSGTGRTNPFTIRAERNSSTSSRSAEVIITAKGGPQESVTIHITQDPTLSVTPESIIFRSTGGTSQVTLMLGSENWIVANIDSMQDWIALNTTAGTGPGPITVTITAGTFSDGESERVMALEFGIEDDESVRKTVEIIQYPPFVIKPSNSAIFTYQGGDEVARITMGTDEYFSISNLSSKPSWVSINPSSGTGTTEFTVTVEGDEGLTTERTFTFNFLLNEVGDTAQYSITQNPKFSGSTNSISFASGGGSNTLNIRCGSKETWTAIGGDGWVTLSTSSGTGSSSVIITVGGTEESRETNITFTLSDSLGQTFTVTIKQTV